MCSTSCSSGGKSLACKIVAGIFLLLTTVTTLAMLVGVYRAHVIPADYLPQMPAGGLLFGSPEGSLAVIAFIASAALWLKIVCKMCPCTKKTCQTDCCKDGACAKPEAPKA